MTDCTKKGICPEATTCKEKDNSVCLDYSPPQTPVEQKTENSEKLRETQKSIPESPVVPIKTVGKVPPKTMFKITNGSVLLSEDIKPISYMIDTILCEESLIYFAGPPGSFKTGFMIHVALCGATGKPVLNHYKVNNRFKTLFLDEENGKRRTKYKFDRLVRGLGLKGTEEEIKDIDFQCIQGFKINDNWISDLERLIIAGGYKLIVVDNIARCFVGSERDEQDVSKIQSLLKPLIENQHVTIVILHHCRKPDEQRKYRPTLNDIRGSGDFGGQCDEAFLLDTFGLQGEHTKIFTLYQLKIKDGEEMPSISIKLTGDSKKNSPLQVIFHAEVSQLTENKKRAKFETLEGKILDWWLHQEYRTIETKHIIKNFIKKGEVTDKEVRQVLKSLKDNGFLVDEPYGYYTNPAIHGTEIYPPKKTKNQKNGWKKLQQE
jgi:hypothetical protein